MEIKDKCLLIVVSIAVIVIVGFAMPLYGGTYGTRTFGGSEQFQSYESAVEFQHDIIKEAESIGAFVEVSISIASPPKVTYRVVLPANTLTDHFIPKDNSFKYYKRDNHVTAFLVWLATGIVGAFACGLFGLVIFATLESNKSS